jgi:hypothetical protein
MATLPTFEPYVLTPLDHCVYAGHLFPAFVFQIENPSSAIPTLNLAVSRLMHLLPFLTGNITASTQLKGKENVLEVQPPTQEFLREYPMLKIKHHDQSTAFATSGSYVKTGESNNESFIPFPSHMAGESKSPIFRFQANIMSDGLILCFAFHHMAIDGIGVFNVAIALATCCRDSQAEIGSLPTSPLREQQSRQSILEIGSGAKNTPPAEVDLGEYEWDLDSSSDVEEPISKTIAIDASKVEQIKAQCQLLVEKNATSAKPSLTSNAIATALLWFCWIRAKYHGSDAGEKPTNTDSRILTVVELRDRTEPRLPSTYIGNALLGVETSARVQEIAPEITVDNKSSCVGHLHPHEIEQISSLAISLQNSAASVNSQYVRNVISNIVSSDNWASTPPPAEMLISSLRPIKLYDIDFGPILGPLKDLCLEFNPFPGLCWIKPARFGTKLAPWEFVISSEPKFIKKIQQESLMKRLILKDGPRL